LEDLDLGLAADLDLGLAADLDLGLAAGLEADLDFGLAVLAFPPTNLAFGLAADLDLGLAADFFLAPPSMALTGATDFLATEDFLTSRVATIFDFCIYIYFIQDFIFKNYFIF
jgi:hypothetical protein